MKSDEKKTMRYEPPCVEYLDLVCEAGFAGSVGTPLQYDVTPSMDYGDEGEQWF